MKRKSEEDGNTELRPNKQKKDISLEEYTKDTLNKPISDINDAFLYAININNIDAMEWLSNHGANINHISSVPLYLDLFAPEESPQQEESPLNYAVTHGKIETIQWLLNHEARVDQIINGQSIIQSLITNRAINLDHCQLRRHAEICNFYNVDPGILGTINLGSRVEADGVNTLVLPPYPSGVVGARVAADGANTIGLTPYPSDVNDDIANLIGILYARGASIDQSSSDGLAPIHSAALIGNIPAMKYLINHEIDINTPNDQGLTPLSLSVNSNDINTMTWLWENGGTVNLTEHNHRINTEAINFLMEKGFSINDIMPDGIGVFKETVAKGKIEFIGFLLDHGVIGTQDDLDAALYLVAKARNISVMKSLIKHNADINKVDAIGYTHLRTAIYTDNILVTEVLLEHGADATLLDLYFALDLVAKVGNVTAMRPILELGHKYKIDINHINCQGFTPLSLAAKHINIPVMKFLLSNGANLPNQEFIEQNLSDEAKNILNAISKEIQHSQDVNSNIVEAWEDTDGNLYSNSLSSSCNWKKVAAIKSEDGTLKKLSPEEEDMMNAPGGDGGDDAPDAPTAGTISNQKDGNQHGDANVASDEMEENQSDEQIVQTQEEIQNPSLSIKSLTSNPFETMLDILLELKSPIEVIESVTRKFEDFKASTADLYQYTTKFVYISTKEGLISAFRENTKEQKCSVEESKEETVMFRIEDGKILVDTEHLLNGRTTHDFTQLPSAIGLDPLSGMPGLDHGPGMFEVF